MEQGRKEGREEIKRGKGEERGSEERRKGKKEANREIEKGSGSYTVGSVRMYTIFLGRGERKPLFR